MIYKRTLKQRLAEDFSASAKVYDRYAFLQRRILSELAQDGEWVGQQVLDAGCGTGTLAEVRPEARILGLDIAFGMCQQALPHMPTVAADMEYLPFADESMDGVFSSLALQWVEKPEVFLREALRVTKKDGWLKVATLVPGTLRELNDAYVKSGLCVPVLKFITAKKMTTWLQEAGWALEDCRLSCMTTEHESVRELLHHLKGLGAGHKQIRGLRTPGDLRRLEKSYMQSATAPVTATWQVMLLQASKSV